MRAQYHEATTGAAGGIAVVLARVVVPLWLAVGAVLKLMDLSPSHLPTALLKWFGGLGLDLMFVLRFSIAVELILAGVMVLLPPLARLVGIIILIAFVPVLVGDLALGASSCGCFGAVEVNPWVTFVMDVTFLFGLLVLGRGDSRLALTRALPTPRVLAAGFWSLFAVMAAFALPNGTQPRNEGAGTGPLAPASNVATTLPADGYYMPQYSEWLGKPFSQLKIASWAIDLPENIDVGTQYIIFYRKDCEHCHELMELFFSGNLAAPTTAIAVPEREGFPTENLQPFACPQCRVAELPPGIDWFLQTPVLVRLADGVVQCAAEVDPTAPECLDQ